MKREGKAKQGQRIHVSPMFVTGAVATFVLLVLFGVGYLRKIATHRQ